MKKKRKKNEKVTKHISLKKLQNIQLEDRKKESKHTTEKKIQIGEIDKFIYRLDYICEVILPHVFFTINFTKQI